MKIFFFFNVNVSPVVRVVAEESEKPKSELSEEVRCCVETESIETGLRKTRVTGSGAGGSGRVTSSPTKSLSPVSSSLGIRGALGSSSRSPSAGSCCGSLQNGDRQSRGSSMARENSNLSRCSSGSRTPREGNSSPEGSPLKRATSGRNSLRKPPAPPTPSPGKACGTSRSSQNGCDVVQPRNNDTKSGSIGVNNNFHAHNNASNTWNGRQAKQRPSLTADTFTKPTNSLKSTNPLKSSSPTNFSRKNPSRQSLPRLGTCPAGISTTSGITGSSQYDRNGRRIKSSASTSLQTSPTKIANPLLEQILAKMSHLRDDKEVVEKLQVLIRDYRGQVVVGSDADTEQTIDPDDPNLEFTRAWIDGNGTVALPSNDVQLVTSPRKDPKPASERGNGFSRIPAPVYKRPMSVASDSL